MGLIYFNGNSSADYGFEIEKPPKHKFPKRIYEIASIPGLNGDSVYDTESYSNVDREYEISFISADTYEDSVRRVLDFLHSGHGYMRLEDTYEPSYYREAIFDRDGEITNYYNEAGTLTIVFNCKPNCWLKSGEIPIPISNGDEIQNGTVHQAKPLITVVCNGAGTISIGTKQIEITDYTGTIILDCEKKDAYYDGLNLNDYITLESEYPILYPGSNEITITGEITSATIIPRWWVI